MIKGTSRRVIVVKHPDGDVFEEAYFIVKEEKFKRKSDKKSLLGEAERIINGGLTSLERKKMRLKDVFLNVLFFILGGIVSVIIFYIIINL